MWDGLAAHLQPTGDRSVAHEPTLNDTHELVQCTGTGIGIEVSILRLPVFVSDISDSDDVRDRRCLGDSLRAVFGKPLPGKP